MTRSFTALRRWQFACSLLFAANAAFAADGCSIYSNYGGNEGKVWFNEYYFGPATSHYMEIFSKNQNVKDVDSSIWSKWYIGVYSSKATSYYSLASNTTACTVSGGRTYITYSNSSLALNHNDAMVVVFDGLPTSSATREIDAFVYSNASPPTPYPGNTRFNYYTPTCPALKFTLDQQAAESAARGVYKGQNILILSNFGTKDNARLPDGIGNWDETSLTGSGTSFTQCVTNDPIDLTKAFTGGEYTVPTYSGTVDPGTVLTFTVAARNATRASMSGVQVSDTLPAGLALTGTPTASAGSTVSCSGAPATCVLSAPASMPPDTTASMTFQATVSPSFAGATIVNTATQTGGTTLSPPPTADAIITVGSALTLLMGADKTTVNYGERVTYTLTATNSTGYAMSGAKVEIPFPTGLQYYTGYTPVVTQGSVTCTATSCVWTLPATYAAGAEATLKFQATATGSAGQSLTLAATQTAGSTLSTAPTSSVTVTMASLAVAGFNACHNFAESNCSRTGGRLYTRRAGVPFSTDIVALKADGTLETGYVGSGGAAKTVRVELINAVSANAVVASQNITFPAGDTTGRVVASWPAMNAFSNLQVRISDTTGATPATSMSSDAFAVRPSGVTVITSANAAPNSTVSTPVIKAGAPFTVSATTSPAHGYGGTLTVDPARLTTSNFRIGNLYAAGTTSPLTVTVNAASVASATYDEVGFFTAPSGAFRDEEFTAVDRDSPLGCNPAANCDCISAGDVANTISDGLVGSTGRYGCYVANRDVVSFARFTPHHFAVKAVPSFTPGALNCGFSYMDQPFSLSAEIEARNSAGGKTHNYHGSYAKGSVTVQMENAEDGNAIADARLNRTDANAWSYGSFMLAANRFARLPAPDGPYDTLAIGVRVSDEAQLVNRDMDNATSGCTKDTPGTSDGTCTAVNLLAAAGGSTSVRFGRLHLSNAHGSEVLGLSVPMRLEYFVAGSGWALNTQDSCTSIGASSIALQSYVPAGFAASMPVSSVSVPPASASTGGNFTAGKSVIRFARPNPAPSGRSSVNVCVDLGPDTASTTPGVVAPVCNATLSAGMPWLQGRWSETKYDDDPVARATFGVYKSGPVIYTREMY